MSNHLIRFTAEEVLAILRGDKTVTRQVVKCGDKPGDWPEVPSPYGKPGDTLWVQETFVLENTSDYHGDQIVPPGTPVQKHDDEPDGEFDAGPYWLIPHYRATEPDAAIYEHGEDHTRWSPSVHMRRWMSRITVVNADVEVQKINGIWYWVGVFELKGGVR